MECLSKIRAFIPKGSEEEESVNRGCVIIRGTKQEDIFTKFGDRDSVVNKLCQLAAVDPLVRLLFFLKGGFSFQSNRDYPLYVSYPIFIDLDKEFVQKLRGKVFEKMIEELTKKRDSAKDEAKDASLSFMYKLFEMFFKDRDFQQRFQHKRLPRGKEADEYYSNMFVRHEKEAAEMYGQWVDYREAETTIQERLEPIISSVENSEDAQTNHLIMGMGGELPRNQTALANALAKIEALRAPRLVVGTVCLECLLVRNLDPHISVQFHPGKPELASSCNKCSGKTIMTTIVLEVPPSLAPLFYEHSLQEFVVGFTIAQSPEIEKVYVHKKVQPVSAQGPGEGKEVDVLAITKDRKALAIEIGTGTDLTHAIEDLTQKQAVLKEIPIDLLVYVSATPSLQRYTQYGDATLMGSKHLVNLTDHILERLGH